MQARDVEIEIIKLAKGGRLLRLSDPESGLAIEQRLDPKEAVTRQKQRLRAALQAARERCVPAAA